jgi:hypothetical protein
MGLTRSVTVDCTAGYMQWRGMIQLRTIEFSLSENSLPSSVALIQSLATKVNVCPDGWNSTRRLVAVGSAADGCSGQVIAAEQWLCSTDQQGFTACSWPASVHYTILTER